MSKKRNIYLLYGISLLQGMVFYGPIATLYREAAGVNIFQITLIESICIALTVLLELPWGVVADRIGYKKTIIFCSFLYVVSKVVFWRATGFAGFLLERVMLAVIISGLSGVEMGMLYLSCEGKESQRVFAIYDTLGTVGLITAAGVYASALSGQIRITGFLTVISYGVAAILSLFLVEVKEEKEEGHTPFVTFKEGVGGLLNNKSLMLFLIAIALFNETHQTITVFLNQLQYKRCGISDAGIGYIYVVVTLAGLLGVFSLRVTKKIGEERFAKLMFFTCGLSCMILAMTKVKLLSIAMILLLRVCFSLFTPLQTEIQNRLVTTKDRATALSVNAVLIDAVAIATNIIFGKIADWKLCYALMAGGIFCFTGYLLFYIWQKKNQSSIA